jgi:hypothetical protein
MGWLTFNGPAKGVTVDGDPSVPATKWYNHLWLLAFGWKKVAVLLVEGEFEPRCTPGYRNAWGQAQVRDEPLTTSTFRVRIGHEACAFFVLDKDGKEKALRVVEVTTKGDPKYRQFPLV